MRAKNIYAHYYLMINSRTRTYKLLLRHRGEVIRKVGEIDVPESAAKKFCFNKVDP